MGEMGWTEGAGGGRGELAEGVMGFERFWAELGK